MALYGYARVSTPSQNITPQIEKLKEAGCAVVRSEHVSGTSVQGRRELRTVLDFMREGDGLVVTRIDRLARSMADLCSIIQELADKGAFLRATEQPFDTSSPHGRLMVNMVGVFAEFENDIRRERQREGIEAAKAAGKYKGRKPNRERAQRVLELHNDGLSLGAIAREVGMSRSGVNRIVKMSLET